MTNPSEEELRKKLEEAEILLRNAEYDREEAKSKAENKAIARESKASENTALIVFVGGIVLAFLILIIS